VLLTLFFVGVCAGYVVAWRWPLVGGLISVVGIAVFLIALGEADMIAIMSILAVPGVLFVLYGLLRRGFSRREVPEPDPQASQP
jgi:hypothetical protein